MHSLNFGIPVSNVTLPLVSGINGTACPIASLNAVLLSEIKNATTIVNKLNIVTRFLSIFSINYFRFLIYLHLLIFFKKSLTVNFMYYLLHSNTQSVTPCKPAIKQG